MATELQKKAVDKIIEKRGKKEKVSISKIMEEVGYEPNTAHNPKNLLESDGYKALLDEYGLTPGLIARALVEDIKSKPGKRIGELNLAAEVTGMKDKKFEPMDKKTVVAIQVIINGNNPQGGADAETGTGT